MLFSEISLFCILYGILLVTLLRQHVSALHLLLTAELAGITLYCLVVVIGIVIDETSLLTLSLYFLLLSAVEFGLGLALLLLQNTFLRTIGLGNSSSFGNRTRIQASSVSGMRQHGAL